MINNDDRKECRDCGMSKPKETAFPKRSDSNDGYGGSCKLCVSMDQQKRRERVDVGDPVVNNAMRGWGPPPAALNTED